MYHEFIGWFCMRMREHRTILISIDVIAAAAPEDFPFMCVEPKNNIHPFGGVYYIIYMYNVCVCTLISKAIL